MKVRVVDDEPDIQPLFEQRFRREIRGGELNFAFAHSGEDALVYLQRHASEVVLILSDINMPGVSGLELLRRIKAGYPGKPMVMMITVGGDPQNHQKALAYGANDFLTKPIMKFQ
ncbi:MAG: response regulator [Ferruginibacter sp.]|nr:response regulator [Cytophagales bacterium]